MGVQKGQKLFPVLKLLELSGILENTHLKQRKTLLYERLTGMRILLRTRKRGREVDGNEEFIENKLPLSKDLINAKNSADE